MNTPQEILYEILKKFFNDNINRGLSWYSVCNAVYAQRMLDRKIMFEDTEILDVLRQMREGGYISDEPVGKWRCKSQIPDFVDYNFLVTVACKDSNIKYLEDDKIDTWNPQLIDVLKTENKKLRKEIDTLKATIDELKQNKPITENVSEAPDGECLCVPKPVRKRRVKRDNREFSARILKLVLDYSDTEMLASDYVDAYEELYGILQDIQRREFNIKVYNFLVYKAKNGSLVKVKSGFCPNENTEKELQKLLGNGVSL